MARARKSLTRQDWVIAARKVFIASGIDDVKVNRLAHRLKISRGSFYWHFRSHKDLLDAVLRDWETRNRAEIEQVRDSWRNGSPDMADVVRIWIGEDPLVPNFDMAVRIWARKSPLVAEVVRAVDDAWIKLLETIFRHHGRTELDSFARARVAYFHQIGYWALAIEEDIEARIQLAPYYHEILTGQAAGPALDNTLEQLRHQASEKQRVGAPSNKVLRSRAAKRRPREGSEAGNG